MSHVFSVRQLCSSRGKTLSGAIMLFSSSCHLATWTPVSSPLIPPTPHTTPQKIDSKRKYLQHMTSLQEIVCLYHPSSLPFVSVLCHRGCALPISFQCTHCSFLASIRKIIILYNLQTVRPYTVWK